MNPFKHFKATGCLVGGAIGDVASVDGCVGENTSFTAAVCESLVHHGKFDLHDCLTRHMRSRPEGPSGCSAIWATLDQIGTWLNSGGNAGNSPDVPANNLFLSTGVTTKIAPLGVLAGLRSDVPPTEQVYRLGRATHGDLRASAAADFHCRLLSALIQQGRCRLERDELAQLVWTVWRSFTQDEEARRVISSDARSGAHLSTPSLGARLWEVVKMLDEGPASPLKQQTPEALRARITGSDYSVMTAVPLALGVFLRHPTDFLAALKEIASLGGRPHNNALLVGQLVGANVGLTEIPDDMVGCAGGLLMLYLARQLINLADQPVSSDR